LPGVLEPEKVIQITPQMRLLLAVEPVDFRKGFVFRNKPATAVKILVYDGQGFWLCQKRLSKGKFKWWPDKGGDCKRRLDAHELQLLIWNGNPLKADAAPPWKKLHID
jgi:transposase